jgi:EmrB/QacA subfamily drug resistance transporter
VLASLLVLSGSTADRIGLVLFTAGSALCAVAPNLGVLIGSRALQAIGGSMLNPVALSIIRDVFHDPRERATALGLWGATFGISMALGPILGGALVDGPGWRFVFLVNLPICALALVLMTIFVPESRAEHPRRIDPIGQILVIVGLFSLVYATIEGPSRGWTAPEIVALFVLAGVAFALLVPYELHHPQPLIEMRFFRSAPFSGASVIAVLAFAALTGFQLLNTLYLQEARGFSALAAGLATLPIALMIILLAPIAGRIVGIRGPRLPLVVAGAAMTAGPLLLSGLSQHTPLSLLLCSYFVFGIGMGLVNLPITNTALAGMPPSQAGVAAAIASASRQVGSTLGIAVIGALVGATGAAVFGPALGPATHPGWWMMAALGIATLVLGILTTTPWAHETARRTAARLQATSAPERRA